MTESVHIVLPLPNRVLSPNCMIASPGGRFMKVAATKKARQIAKEAIEAEELDTIPWNKVKVSAIFYHKVHRIRDEDNYQGMLKATYDGLVDSGLVDNDDSLHMSKPPPKFEIDKIHPRVEIFIERLE